MINEPTLLALVIAEAEHVFESPIAAIEWVYAPSTALGDVAPFDLLKSDNGVQLVLSELGRIEYGLPV